MGRIGSQVLMFTNDQPSYLLSATLEASSLSIVDFHFCPSLSLQRYT